MGKIPKGRGVKAIPKDLEHIKRFYIVEFHLNSFKFGQNVQRGGWGLRRAKNIGALFLDL